MRLDVHLEGQGGPIGRLERADDLSLRFAYLPDALAGGRPLSLSLPLREESYGDVAARAFFDNLLQENAALDLVMARHAVARNDVAGLLWHLGRDCAGALSCVPEGEEPGKMPGVLAQDYDPLPESEIERIMRSLAENRRLPTGSADPSPLAGVQGKIAVAVLADGGLALAKPGSGAPTTHILKVPSRGEGELVDHERALMMLAAQALDHPVAETAILEAGQQRGLLVRRFDRRVEEGRVHRLHQEDFAQALGLPAALKYERAGAGGRAFTAARVGWLLGQTRVPLTARQDFRAMTLLNLAVGNTDNHAKNHALLYDRPGPPVLAPLYDVVPVLTDPNVTHDFAFRLGDAEGMEALTLANYLAFQQDIGFRINPGSRPQVQAVQGDADRLLARIAAGIETLSGPRLKILGDLVAHQIGVLNDALGLAVPLPVRDAFIAGGGGPGWAH